MTSSFNVDADAVATAGKAFASHVDEINSVATAADDIDFGPGKAGRDYHAGGSAYQNALRKFVQSTVVPMGNKTTWVGDTLATSAADYKKQDGNASQGVTDAGRGA